MWDLAGGRRAQRITYEDATVEEFWLDYAGRSLVRERDDDGWQRWWHTAPGDALPIAYTINCDESWDGDDLNESCAQVPRWLYADEYVPDTPGTNRATYLLIRNMRGDVQALATTDGRIIESYAYGLYGAVAGSTCTLVESSTLCAMDICLMLPQCTERVPAPGQRPVVTSHGNTALWAGVHRDLDTGWDWMGARVYLPELRQFLSRDPAGYSVSFDEWAYTPGDPWNYLDRSGWSPDAVGNPGQGNPGHGDRWKPHPPIPGSPGDREYETVERQVRNQTQGRAYYDEIQQLGWDRVTLIAPGAANDLVGPMAESNLATLNGILDATSEFGDALPVAPIFVVGSGDTDLETIEYFRLSGLPGVKQLRFGSLIPGFSPQGNNSQLGSLAAMLPPSSNYATAFAAPTGDHFLPGLGDGAFWGTALYGFNLSKISTLGYIAGYYTGTHEFLHGLMNLLSVSTASGYSHLQVHALASVLAFVKVGGEGVGDMNFFDVAAGANVISSLAIGYSVSEWGAMKLGVDASVSADVLYEMASGVARVEDTFRQNGDSSQRAKLIMELLR
jgi:RHS repeat-associated protein